MTKVLVPLSPERFLVGLKGVIHPALLDIQVWGWTDKAVEALETLDQAVLIREQGGVLKSVLHSAKQLSEDEECIRGSTDPHVAAINSNKRLLRWKELLDSIDHEDLSKIDELREGFKLTGWITNSHLYRPKLTPMQMNASLVLSSQRRP